MKAKIKLPESLREITLAQYQYFLSKAEGLEGEELKAAMLECFALINPDKIRIIEKGSVDEIAEHIDGLFIGERELVQKFELKGFKFGFIPELDKMSFGEYIDLDKYIGDWKEMHRAMAVLYRPITTEIKEQYNVVDYEGTDEYAELMKLMPLDAVLSAQVFFWNLGKELLAALPTYLEMEGKQIIQLGHSSAKSGDGTAAFTNSLKETLETLTQSLEHLLDKPLPTSPLNKRNNE